MRLQKYINEQSETLLFTNEEEAKEIAKEIKKGIDVPFISVKISGLGGKGRETILINCSLDEKKDWVNGIYQNSRYFNIHLFPDYSKSNLEMFGKSYKIEAKKMRKQKAKSVKEVIKKINTWISKL